jgi:hypothetical protein
LLLIGELNTTYRLSQNMASDKRIRPLLSSISKHQLSATPAFKATAALGAVTVQDIPVVSVCGVVLCVSLRFALLQ